MKFDTDENGNFVIKPTGDDSPFFMGIRRGVVLVLTDGTTLEAWEEDGRIRCRKWGAEEEMRPVNLRDILTK